MEGSTQELRRVLSAPPPNWQPPPGPSNPITILHASLEHLRTTGDSQYLFLRTILEVLQGRGFLTGATKTTPPTGEEEQLLFHCITGLRHVMLFRWDSYQPSFRLCLSDFLLAIGLGVGIANNTAGSTNGDAGGIYDNANLPRTVAMACLSCAASFWKRGWTEDQTSDGTAAAVKDDQQTFLESFMGGNMQSMQRFHNHANGERDISQELLFGYLNALVAAPFEQQAQQQQYYTAAMAASFLTLLVGEFTGGNSSARYNLPLEFHRLCHLVFEIGRNSNTNSLIDSTHGGSSNGKKSGLDSTLHLAMGALSSFVGFILKQSTSGSDAALQNTAMLDLGYAIMNATQDTLYWDFGVGAKKWSVVTGGMTVKDQGVLLRPPHRWREVLINPEMLGAMFQVYNAVRVGCGNPVAHATTSKRGSLAHSLRQLLLQLSSVASGPIFNDETERGAYAGFLLDGCLNQLEGILKELEQYKQQHGRLPDDGSLESELLSAEIVDLVTILSRLTTNFRIQILSQLPSFTRYLSALATMGKWLLDTSLAECQRVQGDVELMEGVDWRNDAISHILACSDAMADDYWLVSGVTSGKQEALQASQALQTMLAPLYGPYCLCRVRMSSMEEHYMTGNEADLDEIREEISAFGLEEEMTSAASLGRLSVFSSIQTIGGMFQECLPRLLGLFEGAGTGGDITAEMAALLEEARMLFVCAGHLLTDDCVGETPAIPEAVISACTGGHSPDAEQCTAAIAALIEMLKSVAEAQAMKVASHPYDPRLSPLLAKTLLWFFGRWGPAYILPQSDEYRENATVGILGAYSTRETAQPVMNFCTTLCLMYFCHWPQEKEVQDASATLLLALAKKGALSKIILVDSPSFEKIAALHSVCASLRHNASPPEITAAMSAVGGDLSTEVVRGYVRLPYDDRAKILTSLVVACSEISNEKANGMLEGCMKAVEAPFSALVNALGDKRANCKDINVQESACLSILLYGGIVLASEMSEPDRVPHFLTPSLPYLSGLMTFYAEDLTICDGLLKLFRDYAEQYISMLTRSQCIDLFTASSSLLKHYSEHHCKNRVIHKRSLEAEFEEEQKYNDVVSCIQLLIHLGTKDFTSLCNTPTNTSNRVESTQITDVIFYGLQQILPLMSQGLLQYPTLCLNYFSLVGFMVETYPEKLCALPFDLFNSLLESLLFGMSHSNSQVSKCSLQGLASLAKEHLKCQALATHLSTKPDIFENCTQRLIKEVIFQPIIWDRLEPSGMALLPLVAVDVQKFIVMVTAISQQLVGAKQSRLQSAFEKLIKPEMLAKVAAEGREGRVVRVQFKNDFDVFVRDVQSFLVIS